ncbi:MAG: type II toxin-antitoxin system RelE/ParE family toxin [Acidobacteriota bacterium]
MQALWTHEAVASLREVYRYIARDRPATAARTIESIVAKVASISAQPSLGQRYPHEPPGVRHLTYGHFRIGYRVRDDGAVEVLGIFDGRPFPRV